MFIKWWRDIFTLETDFVCPFFLLLFLVQFVVVVRCYYDYFRSMVTIKHAKLWAIIHISCVCVDASRWLTMHSIRIGIHTTWAITTKKRFILAALWMISKWIEGCRFGCAPHFKWHNVYVYACSAVCSCSFIGRSNSYSENYYVIFSKIVFRIFLQAIRMTDYAAVNWLTKRIFFFNHKIIFTFRPKIMSPVRVAANNSIARSSPHMETPITKSLVWLSSLK